MRINYIIEYSIYYIMDTSELTLSSSSSQKYLLKILEIPGKSVTQKYIDSIKNKLDSLELKYSFDIVLDENLIENLNNTNGVQSGGASTYPFNVFESFLDSFIRKDQSDKNWITTTNDKLEQYKNKQKSVFEKFFSYKPLDDVKEVTFDTTKQPIEMSNSSSEEIPDGLSEEISDEVVKHTIDIPPNFTGILYIQVTIFKPSNGLVLGLRELNQIE
jgi:hypothetical protein